MAFARIHIATVSAGLLVLAPVGCADNTDTAVTAVHTPAENPATKADGAATPTVGEASAPIVPVSLPEGAGKPADEPTSPLASGQETAELTLAEYAPPFPDRVDLFVPPKRQGGVVLKEGGTEDAVELLGFIRLDKQQVVLSVNGQLTRIAEGDSQYGIEVISIQPPEVVLQRGRQRWQASLEK